MYSYPMDLLFILLYHIKIIHILKYLDNLYTVSVEVVLSQLVICLHVNV